QKAGLSIAEAADAVGWSASTIYRWDRGEQTPRRAAIDKLQRVIADRVAEGPSEAGFSFIDLFAGIGGLRRGFEGIGGQCNYTSEWNSWSQTTYQANFPGDLHPVAGDITQISAKEIPAHDVLLAGFPCQPFSIAGVSKKNALGRPHGFRCDAQGTLFFDVARILEHHRPKAFLLENVKNLVSHDKGNTFRVIRRTLTEELGYHVAVKVIDASRFVPQHRERIFIVGMRDSAGFTLDDLPLPPPHSGPVLGSILHPEDGSEAIDEFTLAHIGGPKGRVWPKYTLSSHLWTYLQNYARKHQEKGNGFGFGLVGPNDVSRTLSARYFKDGSEILVKQKGKPPRRLTPRECARLMGFDEPGQTPFRIPVSDTQAYKQFGNAVVVPVVRAVAAHMKPWITGEADQDLFYSARGAANFG
ncbi:MAG: DNA (cytosine-5-)-methyltransferase, partial [Steroidobacteraceae bacterium]